MQKDIKQDKCKETADTGVLDPDATLSLQTQVGVGLYRHQVPAHTGGGVRQDRD